MTCAAPWLGLSNSSTALRHRRLQINDSSAVGMNVRSRAPGVFPVQSPSAAPARVLQGSPAAPRGATISTPWPPPARRQIGISNRCGARCRDTRLSAFGSAQCPQRVVSGHRPGDLACPANVTSVFGHFWIGPGAQALYASTSTWYARDGYPDSKRLGRTFPRASRSFHRGGKFGERNRVAERLKTLQGDRMLAAGVRVSTAVGSTKNCHWATLSGSRVAFSEWARSAKT